MKRPFFSVLIPVYNAEKYLTACVESVLRQTMSDYELILVDDGSTDASGAICDEYARAYPRVRAFHKANEGVVLARRFLLERALGDFLLFMDADDMWEQGLLEMAYDTIAAHGADLVLFTFHKVDGMGREMLSRTGVLPDQAVITKADKGPLYAELVRGSWLNSLCTKVIKRELVDFGTDYQQWSGLMMGEDLLQSLPLFQNAQRIVYRDRALYRYRMNHEGITSNFRPQYIKSLDVTRRALLDALRAEGFDSPENLAAFYAQYLVIMYLQVLKIVRMKCPAREKKQWLQAVRDFALFQRAVSMGSHRQFEPLDQFAFFLFRNRADTAFLLLIKASRRVKNAGRFGAVCHHFIGKRGPLRAEPKSSV